MADRPAGDVYSACEGDGGMADTQYGAASAEQASQPKPPGAGGNQAEGRHPGSGVGEVLADGPLETDAEHLAGVDGELDALFRDFFRSTGSMRQTPRAAWRPPTDVFETAAEVVVKMEVAGVSKDDLKVTFEEECLQIRGRRKERFDGKKVAVNQMEVEYGVFERNITIRQAVDIDSIEATYNDGFLIVRIAKRQRRRGGGSVIVVV